MVNQENYKASDIELVAIVGMAAWIMQVGHTREISVTVVAGKDDSYHLEIPPEMTIRPDDVAGIQRWLTSTDDASFVVAADYSIPAQEVWRLMPALGQFDLSEGMLEIPLDPLPFTRGFCFHVTRLSSLVMENPRAIQELLEDVLSLLRAYPALRRRPVDHNIGALKQRYDDPPHSVVRYKYGSSKVKEASREALRCGCYGSAVNFVSLARSGADKEEAARIVQTLREAGAEVQVHRADAADEAAVVRIVREINSLFEQMAHGQFTAIVRPKVAGALSLHNALAYQSLDFFIMTSSLSAVLGIPSQTNYCAANFFLDALARHRCRNGQAATALALPMILDVGVVAENEHLEVALTRKAIYGIDESEMLHSFEVAMHPAAATGPSPLILGVEPTFLARAIEASQSTEPFWCNDARFCLVRSAVDDLRSAAGQRIVGGGGLMEALRAAETRESRLNTVTNHIMEQCGRILMVPVEKFEHDGPSIASYGLDSMIGVELRSWLFEEFGLDMDFQSLLRSTQTFRTLSEQALASLSR
ncbi:KR domain-containing protein [Aspergillus avenaceus]|uniref:KR domain-containing protein n=1 Tax=Aspergillus avenaceus TaxID=36643 RepID=A0A5N6U0B5_ASPAV|nr:KR domain-containing protein [Aspergillus avenaceus]